MSGFEVFEWNESAQEISEDLIRAKFSRPEYRLSSKKYQNNENRPAGAARAGLLFVIKGKCRCNFGGDDEISIILKSGQYVNFPEGSYQIEPVEGKDVEVVFVWNVLKLFKEIFPDESDDSP